MGVLRLFELSTEKGAYPALTETGAHRGARHAKAVLPLFFYLPQKQKRRCQKMNGTNGTISMSGEKMDVFIDAGCLAGCKPGLAAQLPSIVTRLCKTLSMRSVARYFIRDIRIGETISLVDKKAGYAFRLKVGAHDICVMGIYENQPPKDNTHVLYLVNTNLLRSVAGRMVAA